jgi:uncharacterized protein (DUF2384 family)
MFLGTCSIAKLAKLWNAGVDIWNEALNAEFITTFVIMPLNVISVRLVQKVAVAELTGPQIS